MNESFRRKLSKVEWSVAVLATLAALHFHWIFFRHAGALWRDEVAITNIAMLPSMGEVWAGLPHDHCPLLFPLLLRSWPAGLRVLGLGIGLSLLAAIWIATRTLSRGLPLLSLVLAGLSVTFLRAGDSLRAYGLATTCALLTMAFIWRFVEAPSLRRGLLATAAAVLSVQALYQSAFLVLAACLAGAAVCSRRHQPRNAIAIVGVGLAAGVSLLPYVKPIHDAQDWWVVNHWGTSFPLIWDKVATATGFPFPFFAFVWVGLIALAAALGMSRGLTRREPAKDLFLFTSIALVAGVAGFAVFIRASGLPTQPWYYIPAMGFAVVCCDAILSRAHTMTRTMVVLIAIVTAPLAYSRGLSAVRSPQTNCDLVAARIAQSAGPDDLIIVHPWHLGLSFARYYHGATPWTTLPPLEDYRFHRYDLIKAKLQMTDPIGPVLAKVEETLRSGHRVWFAGRFPATRPGEPPPEDLPPAPNSQWGWFDEPYTQNWGAKIGHLIVNHVTDATAFNDIAAASGNPTEKLALVVVSGWRDSAAGNAR